MLWKEKDSLRPIRLLQQLRVRKPKFLRTSIPDEPKSDVRSYSLRNLLPPAELQARRERHGVLDGLRGAVAGGGKIGVCGVTDLNDAGIGRGPAGLGIAPEEFEVDDGLGRGALYEGFEDGGPGIRANAFVHLGEDFR